MLKVLPIQSKNEQEAICARCNIKFKEEALAYAATVDEKLVGVCQFTMGDGVGKILDLAAIDGVDDFEAMFIMGRAALNFIDLCGVHRALYASEKLDETLVKAIGFKKNADGSYEMDLTDFFNHPCQHH